MWHFQHTDERAKLEESNSSNSNYNTNNSNIEENTMIIMPLNGGKTAHIYTSTNNPVISVRLTQIVTYYYAIPTEIK